MLSVESLTSDDNFLLCCCASPVVPGMHSAEMIKDHARADDNANIDSLHSMLDDPCSNYLHSLWQHFTDAVQYNKDHFVSFRKVCINHHNLWISNEIIQKS